MWCGTRCGPRQLVSPVVAPLGKEWHQILPARSMDRGVVLVVLVHLTMVLGARLAGVQEVALTPAEEEVVMRSTGGAIVVEGEQSCLLRRVEGVWRKFCAVYKSGEAAKADTPLVQADGRAIKAEKETKESTTETFRPDVNVKFSFDDVQVNSNNEETNSVLPEPRGNQQPIYFDARARNKRPKQPYSQRHQEEYFSNSWVPTNFDARKQANSFQLSGGEAAPAPQSQQFPFHLLLTSTEHGELRTTTVTPFLAVDVPKATTPSAVAETPNPFDGPNRIINLEPEDGLIESSPAEGEEEWPGERLSPQEFLRICFHNGTGCDFRLPEDPPEEVQLPPPSTLSPLEVKARGKVQAVEEVEPREELETREEVEAREEVEEAREEVEARVRACFLHGQCSR